MSRIDQFNAARGHRPGELPGGMTRRPQGAGPQFENVLAQLGQWLGVVPTSRDGQTYEATLPTPDGKPPKTIRFRVLGDQVHGFEIGHGFGHDEQHKSHASLIKSLLTRSRQSELQGIPRRVHLAADYKFLETGDDRIHPVVSVSVSPERPLTPGAAWTRTFADAPTRKLAAQWIDRAAEHGDRERGLVLLLHALRADQHAPSVARPTSYPDLSTVLNWAEPTDTHYPARLMRGRQP